MKDYSIIPGDVMETLGSVPSGSYDGCLCDPPYGFTAFTQRKTKAWEKAGVPLSEVWVKVYDALQPGALLMAATGAKTYDLIASDIRAAGFEMKTMFLWMYTQASCVGVREGHRLKPAFEPYVVAMKPRRSWSKLHGVFNKELRQAERVPAALANDKNMSTHWDLTLGRNVSDMFFICNKVTKSERAGDTEHPTLKPLALTEYLAKLIYQPGAKKLLVPFSGSGSEVIGALKTVWPLVTGLEQDRQYVKDSKKRKARHAA